MHKQGRYTITVTVDGDNAVAESDESDNTLTVGFDFAGVVTPEWSRVQAEEGRTLLGDGTDVIVASMDDAFDFNHPWVSGTDSKGRPRLIAAYQNAFGPDGSPINAVHSTALMGIVLARGSNSGDITGMAPDARYVSAEFLNRAGISGHGVRHVFDAAGLVADSGAEVINMSWSWWSGSDFASQTGETSLTNLMADYLGYGRNIVCVAAINQLDDFMRPTAPGSSRNVITVGGLHDDLVHAWELQDHGPTLDGRSKPDLLGNDSENAVAMDPAWREGFPAAEGWWGTSFSAPFVTGAAAQMLDYGKHHGESTDHRVIKAIIMNSGVKTSGSKGQPWASSKSQPLDPEQGTGVLNMVRVHQMYSCGKQSPGVIGSKGYDLGEVSGTASTGEGFQLYRLGTPITPNAVLDFTLVWDRHTFWNDANQSGRIDEGDSFFTTATDRQDNLDLALLYFGAEVEASRSVVDTVEHLHLEELPMGFYEIRVERLPVTNSGADESYALAWHSPDAWAFCDSEGDGDNDLLDAAAFQNCFASQLPTCLAPFDLDRNDEIALSDLSLMVITSTGPK